MEASTATRLDRARAAFAARAWPTARDCFQTVVDDEPTCAEAVAGLADALWWVGETDAAIRRGEQAYSLFRHQRQPMQAALRAIALYLHYRVNLGNRVVARGWLARLARLVADFDLAPLAGWVAVLRAHDATDPVAAAELSRTAMAAARDIGSADLELCALSQCGASLVQQGILDEGTRLLDEAMAAAIAGECDQPETVVFCCCNVIGACWQVADVKRVREWVHVADAFAGTPGAPHLYTHCRVHHGAARFLAGDWSQAECELTAALRGGATADPALRGAALGWLARLRLAQGRRAEALQLLEGYEDHASYVYPRAAAHLAGGESESAIRLITERLCELEDEESGRRSIHAVGSAPLLEQAELLELLVQSCLAARRLPDARSHAERLTTLAAATTYPVLVARADRAAGLVHAAAGSAAAGALLRRSVRTFAELGLVPDAARTRFALAMATVGDDRPGALMLAERALVDLDRLGDATADATARFLRDNGAHTGRRPRPSVATLTRREQEVLRLLGEGLTNRELAARLFLSRKTVEHHVHNVLTKLGLHTRSEAAALAVRELDNSATN